MRKSNLLSYADARERKGQATAPATKAPRANPAQLWIDSRKPGQSQQAAASRLSVVARLLGYGTGKADDWTRCPWHTLKYEDIQGLRGKLLHAVTVEDKYTSAVANNVLKGAMGVMKEVWRMSDADREYLTDRAWLRIQDIPKIAGKRLRKPRRTPTDDEFAALLAACAADTTPRGQRDLAILGVAGLAAGPRESELLALDLADYDRAGKRLRMPQIKTETSEEDIWQPLEPPVTDWLDAWIAVRGAYAGPLFVRLERGGLGRPERLSIGSITNHVIQRRSTEIGIEGVTTHSLRRYFVRSVLRLTGDLSMAQKLVRHASSATTAMFYDARDNDEKRETIKRLPQPGTNKS